jgi:hypothetical protein
VEARYAPEAGGYTPGDAYDLFLDEGGRMVAWVFRKGGAPEPSLATTFEDWTRVGPLQIAADHRTADGSLRIRFADLGVTLAPGVAVVASPGGPPVVEVGPAGCRIRGVDVPLGSGSQMAPIVAGESTFDEEFQVMMGANSSSLRLSTAALAPEASEPAASVGFGRCDVRALGAERAEALLAGASREERALLVTLGLAAWLPADAPRSTREQVREAARACVDSGACGGLVGALGSR